MILQRKNLLFLTTRHKTTSPSLGARSDENQTYKNTTDRNAFPSYLIYPSAFARHLL